MYRIVQNLNKKSLDRLISSMFLFNLRLSMPVVTVKIFMLRDVTLLHVQLSSWKMKNALSNLCLLVHHMEKRRK